MGMQWRGHSAYIPGMQAYADVLGEPLASRLCHHPIAGQRDVRAFSKWNKQA